MYKDSLYKLADQIFVNIDVSEDIDVNKTNCI